MSGLIPSDSASGPQGIPLEPVPRGHQEHIGGAEEIIQQLGAGLANAVNKTLHAKPISPNDPEGALARIAHATNIIQVSRGAPIEAREQAMSEVSQYAALVKKQLPNIADGVHKQLDAISMQVAFEQKITPLIERAYAILEDLSDQTVGLQAGHGEVYQDHLQEFAAAISKLEEVAKTGGDVDRKEVLEQIKWLKSELEDETRDLLKALGPEIKRAKNEYKAALEAWQQAEKTKDPITIFAAFVRLEETIRHIQKIGESKTLETFGDDVKSNQKALAIELTQMMDQCEPDAIRKYVTSQPTPAAGDQKAFFAFKRAMRPFFTGKPPLLPAQKKAFEEAKKEATLALAKYEGVPTEGYNYSAKYDREMRTDYLNDRMTEVERKKLHELTSLETDNKVSKTGLFFLAMQALVLLRGGGSLLLGQDAAALKVRAEQMHRQVMDAIDPTFRAQVEKDGSRLGTLLSDKWEAMRKMDPATLDKFLSKLSPYAQEAVEGLIQAPEKPTSAKIQAACDAVIAKQLAAQVPCPYKHMSVGEWISLFMSQEPEEPPASLVGKISATPGVTQAGAVARVAQDALAVKSSVAQSLTMPNPVDYGNKHTRIVELNVALKDDPRFIVPLPFGFKDGLIQDFLDKANPRIRACWSDLKELYDRKGTQSDREFLENPKVLKLIAERQKLIIDVFDKAADDHSMIDDNFLAWLEPIRARGSYLMVRSTGDEDTKVSNAGGASSSNYVPTNLKSIISHVGKTVASYGGVNSIANRLNGKDENPFLRVPKSAVTIQELIGEPIGGTKDPKDIPVSWVMFTNEPDYGGSDTFRIMTVSATYGHGEAVVDGTRSIATDSYMVLRSKIDDKKIFIVPNIAEKRTRLAPMQGEDGKIVLTEVENPPELRHKAALSEEKLQELLDLALRGEALYGKPQDLEGISRLTANFPVQIRDVNRLTPLPSTLNPKAISELPSNPILTQYQGKVLVPGRSMVVIVDSPEQLLSTVSLGDAEKSYDSAKHKMVVTELPEPRESHFVVNFSGLGQPALQLTKTLPTPTKEKPLVFDLQAGTVNQWDKTLSDPESCIINGYLHHPANVIALSEEMQQLPALLGMPNIEPIEALAAAIAVSLTQEKAHQIIEELCAHTSIRELQERSRRLEERLGEIPSKFVNAVLKRADALDKRMIQVCQESIPVAQERIETLFKAKVLKVTAIASIETVARLEQAEAVVAHYEAMGRASRLHDLILDSDLLPIPQLKDKWVEILKRLEGVPKDDPRVVQLLELSDLLRETGGLGRWLTMVLATETPDDPSTLMDTLLKGLDSHGMQTLRGLAVTARQLTDLRTHIMPAFANPNTFDAAWSTLGKTLDEYLDEEHLKTLHKAINEGHPAVGQMIGATLERVVHIVDSSIKSMKASASYSVDQKIAHFKTMVTSYMNLFERWVTIFSEGREGFAKREQYVAVNKRIAERIMYFSVNENTLYSSKNFDVTHAMLLSGTRYYTGGEPGTVEDLFTLAHQNLLSLVALISNQVMNPNALISLLPPSIAKAIDEVKQELSGLRIQCLRTEVDPNKLEILYNVPLRDHSMPLAFTYSPQTHEATLEVSFMGGNEHSRWDFLSSFLWAFDQSGDIQIEKVPSFTSLTFSTRLALARGKSHNLGNILKGLAKFSLDPDTAAHNKDDQSILKQLYESLKNSPDLDLVLSKVDQNSAMAILAATWSGVVRKSSGALIMHGYSYEADDKNYFDESDRKILASCLRWPNVWESTATRTIWEFMGESSLLDYPQIRKSFIEGFKITKGANLPKSLVRMAEEHPDFLIDVAKALTVRVKQTPAEVMSALNGSMRDKLLSSKEGVEQLVILIKALSAEKDAYGFDALFEGTFQEHLEKTETGRQILVDLLVDVAKYNKFKGQFLPKILMNPEMRSLFAKRMAQVLENTPQPEVFEGLSILADRSGIKLDEVGDVLVRLIPPTWKEYKSIWGSRHTSLLHSYLYDKKLGPSITAKLLDRFLASASLPQDPKMQDHIAFLLSAGSRYLLKLAPNALKSTAQQDPERKNALIQIIIERATESKMSKEEADSAVEVYNVIRHDSDIDPKLIEQLYNAIPKD